MIKENLISFLMESRFLQPPYMLRDGVLILVRQIPKLQEALQVTQSTLMRILSALIPYPQPQNVLKTALTGARRNERLGNFKMSEICKYSGLVFHREP